MTKPTRLLILGTNFALLLLAGCHATPDAIESSLRTTETQRAELILEAADRTDVPAAVFGVVSRDGFAQFVSVGNHAPQGGRNVDANSIFEIASMTKAITATAALQLVEQGRIGLDEPLERVLPELRALEILQADGGTRPATRPITLRDLLRHTAGFGYFFNHPLIAQKVEFDPGTGWPMPSRIADGEFDWGFDVQPHRVFEAGTEWLYGQNLGIVGRLVERLSGEDLDTYFKRHIFEPLDMTRSGYNLPHVAQSERVVVQQRGAGGTFEPLNVPRADPMTSFYGGGYLLCTPRDYGRFLQCLLNGGRLGAARILTPESVELLVHDQLPDGIRVNLPPMPDGKERTRSSLDEYDDGYSLGWAIEVGSDDGLRPEGVGYWSGMFNSFYTFDAERGIAVIFLSQILPFDDPQAYELYRTWEDDVYRALRPRPLP